MTAADVGFPSHRVRREVILVLFSVLLIRYLPNGTFVLMAGLVSLAILYFYAVTSWARKSTALFLGLLVPIFLLFLVRRSPELFLPASAIERLSSFLAFEGLFFLCARLISFLVDVRLGVLPEVELWTFLTFVFYFPTWIAGPIARYRDFSVERTTNWRGSWLAGARRIAVGASKFMIAKFIAPYSFDRMPHDSTLSGKVILSVYIYVLYEYLSFSGYTDIAIGISKLLGIDLLENFNKPWLSRNPKDLWFRSHRSLCLWLRDYVFTPAYLLFLRVFGLQHRLKVLVLTIFLTFALSGVCNIRELMFHGTVFTLYLLFDELLKTKRPDIRERILRSQTMSWIARFLTLQYVAIAFALFELDYDSFRRLVQ